MLRIGRPGTRWLSTGYDGGTSRADAVYNVTVPEGWSERDLRAYARDRVREARVETAADLDAEADGTGVGDTETVEATPVDGETPETGAGDGQTAETGAGDARTPVLFTGVAQRHARVARRGSVAAVVTAGVSNPAALPQPDHDAASSRLRGDGETDHDELVGGGETRDHDGTVNVVVVTERSLAAGAAANLVAVAAEAKAATLLATVGVPGTTSDAVVVGSDPDGERAAFSGSATPVGAATRACVRDALRASLASRYADGPGEPPASVADAAHGVVTDERAAVSAVSAVDTE
ncbi:adenosylcobinamide amidohydrolase [Halobaculum sp. MBLA0147]|uniref:adenosylcobinamide amidohydrolase n=1 Tax=Halobaculum sp. MBLA0147 TaxID=3079934 RepID=UPI0035269CD0